MNWFKVWTHCFLLLQKVQVQIHSASCKDGRRTRTHLHHQIRTKHPSESATHNRHLHALRQGLWTVWKTLGHRGHIQGMPWIFRYLKNRIYGENFNGFWFYNTEVIQLPSKENINEPHANIYPSWPCEMIQPEQRSEQKPKPWEKEAIPLPHHITAKRDTYHKGTCPVFNCNNCNVTAGSGKETDQK